jgi:hypothetical protein
VSGIWYTILIIPDRIGTAPVWREAKTRHPSIAAHRGRILAALPSKSEQQRQTS